MSPFVAVVGTINRDRIRDADGTWHEGLGGILYNTLALAALLEGTAFRVRPFGRLGADDRREAAALLAEFPHVETDGLIADPAGTNLSELDYSGGGERREAVRMNVAALDDADLAGANGAAGLLVNMISGQDLAASTAARLRTAVSVPRLLDVQALARTPDSPRRPRPVPDWRDWSRAFSTVRGNVEEILAFAGEGDVPAAAAAILAAGAAEVLVTDGARGAERWTAPAGAPRAESVPALPGVRCVDPTGCGDAFLSGVCAARVLGVGGAASAALGAFAAAEVAGLVGLPALRALRGVRSRARARMPALSGLPD